MKHAKGDKVFISGFTNIKANLGRHVRLIEWIPPNAVFNYHDVMVFNGGMEGGWIVTPVDGRNLIGKGVDNIPFISNICLIKDRHLEKVYIPDGNSITKEDARELKEILENSSTFFLNPAEFKLFEEMLEANPLSENKALQSFMSRPNPWS